MATPGQLVECVATALNVPQATVVLYDRVLAENGLRSKGGRGKSAAQVTSEDAANLLIAIAGSAASGIADAVATVERFSSLKYVRPTSWREMVTDDTDRELVAQLEKTREVELMCVPGMDTLRRQHSFRDGLAAVIESTRQRKITFRKGGGDTDGGRAYISLEGPSPRARIHVWVDARADADYQSSARNAFSDLHWKQTFSHRTISAIARLLGAEDVQPAKTKGRAA